MRCARCDRIAVPQALGRTLGGHLVFGWCLDCLEEEGCIEISVARPKLLRRVRPHLGPPQGPEAARRMAQAMMAGMLALWGLTFLVLGVIRLALPATPAGNPFGANAAFALILLGLALKTAGIAVAFRLIGGGDVRLRRWSSPAIWPLRPAPRFGRRPLLP